MKFHEISLQEISDRDFRTSIIVIVIREIQDSWALMIVIIHTGDVCLCGNRDLKFPAVKFHEIS